MESFRGIGEEEEEEMYKLWNFNTGNGLRFPTAEAPLMSLDFEKEGVLLVESCTNAASKPLETRGKDIEKLMIDNEVLIIIIGKRVKLSGTRFIVDEGSPTLTHGGSNSCMKPLEARLTPIFQYFGWASPRLVETDLGNYYPCIHHHHTPLSRGVASLARDR